MHHTAQEWAAKNRAQGFEQVTIAEIEARLANLGYRLDRSLDCRSNARIMSGERAGDSYLCCTTYIREADTGVSFANGFDARRDGNFRALQDLRRSGIFAISGDCILEI